MRVLALLLFFGVALGWNLDAVGVIDYDEAAYAEVSREMAEAGTLLEPRLNGEPWYEKPPLLYWTQILGYRLFGVGEWGARWGNALVMVLLLGVVSWVARRPLGARTATLAAVILGSTLGFVFLTRIALTDGLLTALLFGALGCVHRALESARRGGSGTGWMLGAALCASVGMLAKGLVAFVLPAGTLFFFLLWERRYSWLVRPAWLLGSLLLVGTVGLSWYLALGFWGTQGFGFMRELFLEHHVGRFLTPKEGHQGAFWYYLPVLAVALLPWSLWLIPGFVARPWRTAEDEAGRFLRLMLAFAVLTFVFFSVAATKLPNYVAPLLPPLALFVAYYLGGATDPSSRWHRLAVRGVEGMLALLALVHLALPLVLGRLPGWLGDEEARKLPGLSQPLELGWLPWLASGLLIGGVVASILAGHRNPERRIGVLGTAFFAFLLVVVHGILPRYDEHFQAPLRRLAVQAARETGPDRVLLVGLKRRPSVTFYSGVRTDYCPLRLEALQIAFSSSRVALTTSYDLDRFREFGQFEILAEEGGYVLVKGSASRSAP